MANQMRRWLKFERISGCLRVKKLSSPPGAFILKKFYGCINVFEPENVNGSNISNESKEPDQWNSQSFYQILNLGEQTIWKCFYSLLFLN